MCTPHELEIVLAALAPPSHMCVGTDTGGWKELRLQYDLKKFKTSTQKRFLMLKNTPHGH